MSGLSMATKTEKEVTKKVGRPRATVETVRVSPRLPAAVVERMQLAAELRGVNSSAFMLEAIETLSKKVIEEEKVWKLRETQAKEMTSLLAKPPKPTKFAEEAAKLAAEHVEIRS